MLTILGQTGGPTQLSANDDVFGIMTQVPSGAVMHSPGGLENADGNTAFGAPFTLMAYMTHSTTAAEQSTTVTFTSDGIPYKLRVLSAKVRCVANRSEDFRPGYGFVRAQVQDGDGSGTWTNLLSVEDMGSMEAGNVREHPCLDPANVIVSADEGLRVKFDSQADSYGTNPTATFIVELQCIRVI
jgi:hypothetical protein